jgi:hypothetical protein
MCNPKSTRMKWYIAPFAFAVLLILSCNKRIDLFPNPLTQGCQVAEYHVGLYDLYYPDTTAWLFRKTYNASGRIPVAIECFFTDDVSPQAIFFPEFDHFLGIVQDGRRIFFMNQKAGFPDTVATLWLNEEGRPASCVANSELVVDRGIPVTELYHYNRKKQIIAVSSIYGLTSIPPDPFTTVDSVNYDGQGNPLSFRGNSYQYDYSKKAGQQFYCDDFMDGDDPFYLLEYLGFFPELTNPPNPRIFLHQSSDGFVGPVNQQAFDSQGKLIGYHFGPGAGIPVKIIWNCAARTAHFK